MFIPRSVAYNAPLHERPLLFEDLSKEDRQNPDIFEGGGCPPDIIGYRPGYFDLLAFWGGQLLTVHSLDLLGTRIRTAAKFYLDL